MREQERERGVFFDEGGVREGGGGGGSRTSKYLGHAPHTQAGGGWALGTCGVSRVFVCVCVVVSCVRRGARGVGNRKGERGGEPQKGRGREEVQDGERGVLVQCSGGARNPSASDRHRRPILTQYCPPSPLLTRPLPPPLPHKPPALQPHAVSPPQQFWAAGRWTVTRP
jgi:hypothetical protein